MFLVFSVAWLLVFKSNSSNKIVQIKKAAACLGISVSFLFIYFLISLSNLSVHQTERPFKQRTNWILGVKLMCPCDLIFRI